MPANDGAPTRRRRRRVAFAATIAATLTACGGGSADETQGTSASTAAPADPSTSSESTAPSDDPTLQAGGTVAGSATTAEPAPPTSGQAPATAPAPSYTTPTTIPLPQPVAPPPDPAAPEPVVPLGTLAIPKIGLESTLYEGIRIPTFDLGPGHWPGTAMPGQPGNMVIGAHRTASNADFRHLDQLAAGDEMIVTTGDGTGATYIVDFVEITGPFAAQVIYQTPERTATLFACHPPGSIRQRIVVHLTLAT